jgi:hypothetical protein
MIITNVTLLDKAKFVLLANALCSHAPRSLRVQIAGESYELSLMVIRVML